jgi:ATP-binding cassette subfamily B protein
MLLLSAVLGVLSPRLERASMRSQQATGKLAGAAAETFSGMTILKIFTREDAQMRRLEALGLDYVVAQIRLARARGLAISSLHLLIGLSQCAILLVGSYQIVAGKMSVGDFFTFLEWLALCLWPLIAVGWMVGTIHRGAAAMQRIDEVLDAEPEIESPADAAGSAQRTDVAFEGVTVRYGDHVALDRVSLAIEAGGSLGITGRVGSGKSTLAALLVRLVDPDEGTVRVGGLDVRAWSLDDLRRSVGMVPQDTFLFSETLRENLAFAAKDASDAACIEAARAAAFQSTIEALPDGLDTVLGERGLTLSGGQRQRAALARTLLQSSPVLVLDDCLSAIDAETEARILGHLRDFVRGRTTILISHRAAALRTMDRIAVLDGGRLVEIGSYAELVEHGGLFAELEQRQRLEEELREL